MWRQYYCESETTQSNPVISIRNNWHRCQIYKLFVRNSIFRLELQYGSINLLKILQWHSSIFAITQRHCWNKISAKIFVPRRNMNINILPVEPGDVWRQLTNYIVNVSSPAITWQYKTRYNFKPLGLTPLYYDKTSDRYQHSSYNNKHTTTIIMSYRECFLVLHLHRLSSTHLKIVNINQPL